MLRKSFSLKHFFMVTVNFWTYFGMNLVELCLFREVRYRISKKCSENFIEYFTNSENWIAKWASTQKFFIKDILR